MKDRQNIEFSITFDKRTETANIQLDNDSIAGNIAGLYFELKNAEHSVILRIKNNTDKAIALESIKLKITKPLKDEWRDVLIVPELPEQLMELKPLQNRGSITYKSYMFSLIFGIENNESELLGFLSSNSSQNYVCIDRNETGLIIEMVYNLVHEIILPSGELEFDPIYYSKSMNYIDLLNEYEKAVYNYCPKYTNYDKELISDEALNMNILFSRSPDDNTLQIKNKPCSIKLGGTRYYVRNIVDEEVKTRIMEQCTRELNNSDKPCLMHIQNISLYIKKINELDAFNVYKELNNLFVRLNNVYLEADDCPTAIAKGCGLLLKPKRVLIDEKRINKILTLNNKNDANYLNKFIWDYAVEVVLERRFYLNMITYKCYNTKIESILSEIANNIYKQDRFINDIRDDLPVYFYAPGKGMLSVLRYGDNKIYIAIFNLSDNNVKFYWDLSQVIDENIDGTAEDILNNEGYLIVNKKIYIHNIDPMDCLLIKKALN